MKLTNLLKPSWTISVAGLLLAACTGILPAPVPTTTPVPPTDTPTATIVWFPPTDTPTVRPTQPSLPTAEFLPGQGDLIFNDSFDHPEFWNTASSDPASASLKNHQLILSLNGQGYSITSLRSQPSVGDFYAEVTVSVALCRDKDQYGMVFRASPGEDYYRFTANCAGQVRLERGHAGSISPLQDWLSSGDAPMGGPAQLKRGVWTAGSEMRFFLNDNFQFSVHDPILHAGTLGFFATSNGTTPLIVSFSNLQVYSVSYTPPTATPIPSRTPKPH
jgi:hypothetical protein